MTTQLAIFDNVLPKGVASIEWYTSPIEAALVHDVFVGPPELDPLSCELANRVMQAERFFSLAEDGMSQVWQALTAYVNPPTGLTQAAWRKLVEHVLAGDVGAAIWAGFNIEQLQTLQNAGAERTPLDFPLCVPAQRTRWMRGDGRQQDLFGELPRIGASPRHATFFVLLDPGGTYVLRFIEVFSQLGAVVVPSRSRRQ